MGPRAAASSQRRPQRSIRGLFERQRSGVSAPAPQAVEEVVDVPDTAPDPKPAELKEDSLDAIVPCSPERTVTAKANAFSSTLGATESIGLELPPCDSPAKSRTHHSAEVLYQSATADELGKRKQELVVSTAPQLDGPSDIGSDLGAKTTVRLCTSHASFRWLRRLPPALLLQAAQPSESARAAAEALVFELCRECLPELAASPERATRWLEKIATCLARYELDGPPRPRFPNPLAQPQLASAKVTDPATQARIAEATQAWRCAGQWDEAFRSLEQLLRQGLASSYAIVSERFTLTVLGDGAAAWMPLEGGESRSPTRDEPVAILCPSDSQLRSMLQQNSIRFRTSPTPAEGTGPTGQPPRKVAKLKADEQLVDSEFANRVQADIEGYRRRGELVHELGSDDAVLVGSALQIVGTYHVHALLDVLRQFFLGMPVPGAPSAPARLPCLIAPVPFSSAAWRPAEVVRTHTTPLTQEREVQHVAELRGYFFPHQVRRLTEQLRIALPRFSCTLSSESRHVAGVNAFTKLSTHRIQTIECTRKPGAAKPEYKWSFKLES